MTIKTVESATEEFIIWYANNIDRTSDRALIRAKVTELLKQRDTALIEAGVLAIQKLQGTPLPDSYSESDNIISKEDTITALQELGKVETV